MEVEKIGLDDFLVTHGPEALLKCEKVPFSSPIFSEARRREERRQERLVNGGDAFGGFGGSFPQGAWENSQDAPWPEPGELPGGLLPVPAMAEVMIPEPFRPWLADIAERIQCPMEFPTVGALVSLAGLVGRRVGIHPKHYDDWLVIPNLWGAVIGRPGILKSPALAEAMKPLNRLVMEARKKYEDALKEHTATLMVVAAQKEAIEKKIKEALRKGEDPENIITHVRAKLAEHEAALKPPVLVRYIVNDPTVEKLGELLNQNPHGLLLFRDELVGWFKTLDRSGHENDRAFYLESWNGNGSYTYDRIGRGTLYIEAACMSILGGIQPGPLAKYLREAVKGGSGDDGLMQRFQLLVYPDDPGEWRNVDRWPDNAAKSRAFTIFKELATRSASDLGATLVPVVVGATVTDDEGIASLRFAPGAQGLFDEWRADLEQKIRSRDEHPVLEAHLSKYRSLMPSLALLFHLIEAVDGKTIGPVSKQAAELAAAWCDFLEAHARRIYQGVTQHTLFSARQLADRIKARKLPSPFTPHNVYHNSWTGLFTPEDVIAAAEILEDLHWLRSEKIPAGSRGGRPRFHYYINPRLWVEENAR